MKYLESCSLGAITNAGLIAFNPNAQPSDDDFGLLYIGVGDGGNTAADNRGVDADRNGQNSRSPLGTILRIDPLGDDTRPYLIPANNPFHDGINAMAEVWAYGFRNPQRFSWDLGGSGQMFIADIGQANIEEVSLGKQGGNYGWSEREGTFIVAHSDENNVTESGIGGGGDGMIDPVIQYDHDEGLAITGGFVYRGHAVPELAGPLRLRPTSSTAACFMPLPTKSFRDHWRGCVNWPSNKAGKQSIFVT